MLQNISIILVRPRFPENIGMAARAMANMGADDLVLIRPERWDKNKALPLATPQGHAILDAARLADDLRQALAPFTAAIGTTARLGGWRKSILTPEKAALEARSLVRQGGRVALVFGSEDRGLDNSEVEQCSHLAHIPAAMDKSSLNLAQAVLLMLYECVKADLALPFAPDDARRHWTRPRSDTDSRLATLAEETLLLDTLQATLQAIDYLPQDNPDWFMQPLRRFLRKSRLRRHEFDMLMGICRQMRNKLAR
jgi:tRNA/rRNA methyltransferase